METKVVWQSADGRVTVRRLSRNWLFSAFHCLRNFVQANPHALARDAHVFLVIIIIIIFVSLRPDIAILGPDNTIYMLELTICHETNLSKSKLYKETKAYKNIVVSGNQT